MKWMIASDIHGSALFCEKLAEAFRAEKCGRMILLGDILYHGPRNALPEGYSPAGTAEILNTLKDVIYAVRGNCDAEVDSVMLDFPVGADYIPVPFGERVIFATHGHLFGENSPAPLKKGDIYLYGHTHISGWKYTDGIYYVNPGSVSIPKGDTQRGYILLEDGGFIFKTLDGEEYGRLCI